MQRQWFYDGCAVEYWLLCVRFPAAPRVRLFSVNGLHPGVTFLQKPAIWQKTSIHLHRQATRRIFGVQLWNSWTFCFSASARTSSQGGGNRGPGLGKAFWESIAFQESVADQPGRVAIEMSQRLCRKVPSWSRTLIYVSHFWNALGTQRDLTFQKSMHSTKGRKLGRLQIDPVSFDNKNVNFCGFAPQCSFGGEQLVGMPFTSKSLNGRQSNICAPILSCIWRLSYICCTLFQLSFLSSFRTSLFVCLSSLLHMFPRIF